MIEDSVVDDTLSRLYELSHTAQQQGAEKVHHTTRDAAETIMLLQAEIRDMRAEYAEKYDLTTSVVKALHTYVKDVEDDPILGPPVREWVRLVRYEE
jgi:hypothetical protein